MVRQGAQNKRMASTKLNQDSSRSHSVFTVEVRYTRMDDSGDGSSKEEGLLGTLWIVDLAGSERGLRTGTWQNR